MRVFDWLKELGDDEIVSAVSGHELAPPFSDADRKKRTQIYTGVAYVVGLLIALALTPRVPDPGHEPEVDLPNLVFMMEPGPGGGGGGGGEGSEEPASELEIAGEDAAEVAVNTEIPEDELVFEDPDAPPPEEEEEVVEEEEEAPEIKAPIVAQAPDDQDIEGIFDAPEGLAPSSGSGTGGGAGTGTGTGIGEGEGSGIGPGYGGGFGGGAYRMGSGISPPQLLQQVRPDYTDEALARKIEGTVLLEVVILAEGKVGPVRVLRGLDGGLNEKAISCVRQWVFVPGKLRGQPVDVIGEIEVEFTIL